MDDDTFKSLCATRRGKLGVCTRKMNEIKESMKGGNVEIVNSGLEKLNLALNDFKESHQSVQMLLDEDEKKIDNSEWYESKMQTFEIFLREVDTWKFELQPVVTPLDSISNVSATRRGYSRAGSAASKTSSVTSTRQKAEAERAAILQRAAALHKKHALEREKIKVENAMERVHLETELAATDAKIQVLKNVETQSTGFEVPSAEPTDGMNEYLERHFKSQVEDPSTETSPIEYAHISAIPKTPLQRALTQHTRSQEQKGEKQVEMTLPKPTSHPARSIPPTHSSSTSYSEDIAAIADLIVQQQRMSSLPRKDLPIFNGEPLKFGIFMQAFEHRIENNTSSSQERLYYLEQFTSGQPRELIRSCFHMDADRGYEEAKRLLKSHFGDEFKITNAYIDKALDWNPIPSDNGDALQSYALFLRGCCNLMYTLRYMDELNLPSNLRLLISKVPFKIREKWRTHAYDIQEKTGARATFPDLVFFLERQVRILQDPIFGNLQDVSRTVKTFNLNKPIFNQKRKGQGTSFATTVNAEPQDKMDRSNSGRVMQLSSSVKPCPICNDDHPIVACQELLKESHNKRVDLLKSKGICFGCLMKGHMSRTCKNRQTCSICSQPHPSILHIFREEGKDQSFSHGANKDHNKLVNSGLVSLKPGNVDCSDKQCTLSIVPVQVKLNNSNHIIQTYAFLDPGSSATFCTEHLRRRLNAMGKQQQILLRTMGQRKSVSTLVVKGLEVCSLEGKNFTKLPEVYAQQEIPVSKEHIPKQEDLQKWPYLKDVRMPKIDAEVDLLIGINAPKLLEPWKIINSQGTGPFAIKTLLGWVVNGLLHEEGCFDRRGQKQVEVHRISVDKLSELLIQQYNHDFPEKRFDEKKQMSVEDHKFMDIMNHSVRTIDGHYQLPLPFKRENLAMPNNYHLAQQRAQSIKGKFQRNTQFYNKYKAFMETVVSLGHAEPVPKDQLKAAAGRVRYLPHHGVFHPRKGSLHVVFDCSAAYQGTSLNNELIQGPNLTNTLIGVLIRFRKGKVAIIADVEKMYHQVKVSPLHVDFLRFLWWPGGDIAQPLKEYRMTVHLFGATSSASAATYALKRTAEDNVERFSVEARNAVKNNFYVDDLLMAVDTENHAAKLCQELKSLCATGGFNLTKWISNNKSVLSFIAEPESQKDAKNLDLDDEDLPIERALGVQWCLKEDVFTFKIINKEHPVSRRGILSLVSSIYDPLGFLAPIIFPAKHLLQEFRRQNVGWDAELTEVHIRAWKRWWQDLPKLKELKISRCLIPNNFEAVKTAQMHHFCDASDIGYGTVTYLRLTSYDEKIYVVFLMGKARVSPLKFLTTPRLELTAAVLAVRMDVMLSEELHMKLERSLFWTDSMTVLKYIRSESRRFQTFVANRLNIIRSASNASQWKYISTKMNPADCASRGLQVDSFLKNMAWISGPDFLKELPNCWPDSPPELSLSPDDPELKRVVVVNRVLMGNCDPVTYLMHYFSSWTKLKKTVAWFLRLKSILFELAERRKSRTNQKNHVMVTRKSQQKKSGSYVLSVNDLNKAEMTIVQFCQKHAFSQEMSSLQKGMQNVCRSSSIFYLDPYVESGILRVGGRLNKMHMPNEVKHPAILPKNHHVSKLLLGHIHREVGHGGRNFMLSELRQKFWIPCANSLARKIIHECTTCRRFNSNTGEQKMADLPIDRLTPDLPPFTHVGVDYFGPLEVKRGRSIVKRYGVIFTCLASRAVHLEVAQSLDTDSCIHAFRRFIARRGQVSEMRSDNGTNLVSTERELKEALKSWNLQQIEKSLLQKGVKWTFNPPHGAHHGGIWERLIRMVKRILLSVTNQQQLDDEGLQTVLCEIEAILNSRPLTTVSNNPNDLEPLTPNHLLQMKVQPILPPGLFVEKDLYTRRRWRQAQYIADLFWKRWIKEYVPLLQTRQKWTRIKRNFQQGDIVLVADATAPRGSWMLARVVDALADSKGLVRSVILQTKTSQLERPISKICLLVESNQHKD